MDVTYPIHQRHSLDARAGLLAGLGAVIALTATYWDDSWHTDRGRDEFAIAPHLVLYGGVLMTSLVIAAWAVSAWRAAPSGRVGSFLGDPALVIAGIGGVTTLASAPIDNAWHEAYGRDAVLWSPPHLLAVAGTLALAVGIVSGLSRRPTRLGQMAGLLAGAAVFGALQVPVAEYDSDVAQFSTIWYLPVAAFGLCLALALVEDHLPGRWEPTLAAGIYTGLRAGIVGLLGVLGFSSTAIPPLIIVVVIAALGNRVARAPRLVLVGALAPLVWWPALWLQSATTTAVPFGELPAGIVLGALAGFVVAVIHGDLAITTGARRAALGVVALVLPLAALGTGAKPAAAHDPGQGEEVETGRLVVERRSGRADLTFDLDGPCRGLRAVATVARRAGSTRRGSLRLDTSGDDRCQVAGTVTGLTDGRWFIYAELADSRRRTLEAWLPVRSSERVAEARPLYRLPARPPEGTEVLVGAGIVAMIGAVLVAALRTSRRAAAERASRSASSLTARLG